MIRLNIALTLIISALVTLSPPCQAQDQGTSMMLPHMADAPPLSPNNDQRPLRDFSDQELSERLGTLLRSQTVWRDLVARQKMAVAIVDISDPSAPRYASVNGDKTLYSASMPKIGILLAVFHKIETGEIALTDEVLADLNAMIRTSSNRAATRMIDKAGGLDAVNAVLTDPQYRLYDEAQGGGLWVGKRYAKTGKRVTDPIGGVSHGANVYQTARFYYLLHEGRLVSPERSRQMLEILVDPGINHKFVKALKDVAPEATLYRKSGTWTVYHADSVMVMGPNWRRYILVSVIESPNGGKIMQDLAPLIDDMLNPNIP